MGLLKSGDTHLDALTLEFAPAAEILVYRYVLPGYPACAACLVTHFRKTA
jgi:hypothetical protein